MITQAIALGSRLLLAILLLLSGCQLESFGERQARQRADYLGEAASSQRSTGMHEQSSKTGQTARTPDKIPIT